MRRLPILALLALLGSACSVDAATEEPSSNRGTSTHALLTVERSAIVGSAEPSGMAFAGVVRAPNDVDPGLLLRISGGGLELPALGTCARVTRPREAVPARELGRVEFLDAGDVLLRADATETQLAPRAFPTVSDLFSGVVYTSRDRASEPLPAGARYVLRSTGGSELGALEFGVDAPAALENVTVAGRVLEESSELILHSAPRVTWQPGDARDTVYVEVAGDRVGTLGVCAFRDSEGAGTLANGLFGAAGSGSLSFHRLREVVADVAARDAAEVRFDFELVAPVTFR